jgi:transcriptional regulator with XRE-family HTH domain
VEGELQVAVGRNIRRARQALGLSQEQFGERVGWHRTFVGGVERGERNLTLKTIERLSDQLDLEPLDLLWDRERIAVTLDGTGDLQFAGRRSLRAAPLAAADGSAPPPRGRGRRPRPG